MEATPHDSVARTDGIYARRMANSSLTFLRVLRGKRTAPIELVWHDQYIPANWVRGADSLTTTIQARYAEQAQAKHELAESLRVDSRDPCPNCGVRGDIGCKHRRTG